MLIYQRTKSSSWREKIIVAWKLSPLLLHRFTKYILYRVQPTIVCVLWSIIVQSSDETRKCCWVIYRVASTLQVSSFRFSAVGGNIKVSTQHSIYVFIDRTCSILSCCIPIFNSWRNKVQRHFLRSAGQRVCAVYCCWLILFVLWTRRNFYLQRI